MKKLLIIPLIFATLLACAQTTAYEDLDVKSNTAGADGHTIYSAGKAWRMTHSVLFNNTDDSLGAHLTRIEALETGGVSSDSTWDEIDVTDTIRIGTGKVYVDGSNEVNIEDDVTGPKTLAELALGTTYTAGSGHTLSGSTTFEFGGTITHDGFLHTNGWDLFMGEPNSTSGFIIQEPGYTAQVQRMSNDKYKRAFSGARYADPNYEAFMISDDYFFASKYAEWVLQSDSAILNFGFGSSDYNLVLTETSFKADMIPSGVGPQVLNYDPATDLISYFAGGHDTGDSVSTLWDAVFVDTAAVPLSQIIFGMGYGLTGDTAASYINCHLGGMVVHADDDTITIVELTDITAYGPGTPSVAVIIEFDDNTAFSSPTTIWSGTVTGTPTTVTSFTNDKVPPDNHVRAYITSTPADANKSSRLYIPTLFR